jgi:hypothetical protein
MILKTGQPTFMAVINVPIAVNHPNVSKHRSLLGN